MQISNLHSGSEAAVGSAIASITCFTAVVCRLQQVTWAPTATKQLMSHFRVQGANKHSGHLQLYTDLSVSTLPSSNTSAAVSCGAAPTALRAS